MPKISTIKMAYSITRITNWQGKNGMILSSTKHYLSSYYMQRTALGKETKDTDTYRLCNLQIDSLLYDICCWQISGKGDLKSIVSTLIFPCLGIFVLSKAHFGTWKHHGSFVLFPAKQNDHTTKIRKQLLCTLKQPIAEAQDGGKNIRGQPKVTGRIK